MTKEEEDAIELRVKAASPAPWRYEDTEGERSPGGHLYARHQRVWGTTVHMDTSQKADCPDMVFIAHSREDIETLLASNREMRRERDEARTVARDLYRFINARRAGFNLHGEMHMIEVVVPAVIEKWDGEGKEA